MVECEVLASRLERIAEWQVGLRPADRADLRRAAAIVRAVDDATAMTASITKLEIPTVVSD